MCLCLGWWCVGFMVACARVWKRGWCYVCVSCEFVFLCRRQVQVSVYCARRIPAHFRCTQSSIMLHLIDICFLPCLCAWQISLIQSGLRVDVGHEFVSTSPAFMRSCAGQPTGPHVRPSPKTCKSDPHCCIGAGSGLRNNLHSSLLEPR